MRRRLRDIRSEAKNIDSIRTIRGAIEYILWYLTNTNSSLLPPVLTDSGVGALGNVPLVFFLPPIPTIPNTFQMVFWTSAGIGVGDDQPWWTYYGYDRWYPMKFSTLSGAPTTVEIP